MTSVSSPRRWASPSLLGPTLSRTWGWVTAAWRRPRCWQRRQRTGCWEGNKYWFIFKDKNQTKEGGNSLWCHPGGGGRSFCRRLAPHWLRRWPSTPLRQAAWWRTGELWPWASSTSSTWRCCRSSEGRSDACWRLCGWSGFWASGFRTTVQWSCKLLPRPDPGSL